MAAVEGCFGIGHAGALVADLDGDPITGGSRSSCDRAGTVDGRVVEEHIEDLPKNARVRACEKSPAVELGPQRARVLGESPVPLRFEVADQSRDVSLALPSWRVTGHSQQCLDRCLQS